MTTHGFADPDIIQALHETLHDRLEESLARELSTILQVAADTPIRFDQLPPSRQGYIRQTGRLALRLLNDRVIEHTTYHAMDALARHQFPGKFLRDLTDDQLRRLHAEATVVLREAWARLTDHDYRYLDGDLRDRIRRVLEE